MCTRTNEAEIGKQSSFVVMYNLDICHSIMSSHAVGSPLDDKSCRS